MQSNAKAGSPIGAGGTYRLVIENDGKIGMGTNAPLADLHIRSTANTSTHLRLERYESDEALSNGDIVGDIEFYANDGSVASNATTKVANIDVEILSTALQTALTFNTYNTSLAERMRITNLGDVGIGTNAPAQKLHVVGGQARFDDHISIQPTKKLYLDGGNDTYIDEVAANTIALTTANAERIRIDASGDIGIGTQSPGSYNAAGRNLVVADAGDAGISIIAGSSSDSSLYFGDGTGGTASYRGSIKYDHATDAMLFHTAATESARIDSVGDFHIGDSGAISGNMLSILVDNSRTGNAILVKPASNATINAMVFKNSSNANAGFIQYNASSTSYATSSDYRLKENVDYTWDATTRLKQLKPAQFNWIIDESNTPIDGFIAHEVSSIVPQAVTGTKDAVDDEGNPDYQGIDNSHLVPLLVKTIQELEARIATLEG